MGGGGACYDSCYWLGERGGGDRSWFLLLAGGGGGQVMVLITGRAAIDLGVCCLCARYCVVMTTVVTQTLYGHIVSDIKRLNHKHRNNTVNTVSCVESVRRWSLERVNPQTVIGVVFSSSDPAEFYVHDAPGQ